MQICHKTWNTIIQIYLVFLQLCNEDFFILLFEQLVFMGSRFLFPYPNFDEPFSYNLSKKNIYIPKSYVHGCYNSITLRYTWHNQILF